MIQNSLLLLLAAALVYGTTTMSVAAPVRVYSVTTIAAEDPNKPSWALYDSSASSLGNRSSASNYDDGPIFDPIGGFCMPYFQMDSVSFFISPNGYIAIQPNSQCQYICSSDATGYIKFNTNSSQYGDFSVIGLYIMDLNPSTGPIPGDSQSNTIFKRVFVRQLDDGMGGTVDMKVALVEFNKVQQWRQNPSIFDTTVTAAAELWENGTIILRYKSVLQQYYSNDGFPASTGLIWTKDQRVSTVTVRYKSASVPADYIAIRYDPGVNSTCSVHTDCNSCALAGVNNTAAQQYLDASDCVWCGATEQCVPYKIIGDFCGPSDRNICLQNKIVADTTPTGNAQPFYRIDMVRQATWNDIRYQSGTSLLSGSSENITLGFNFSYFYNPPNKTANSSRITDHVTLLGGNFLSVLSSTQPCFVDSFGLCGNADYSFAIVPFAILFSQQSGQTIHVLKLDARNNGDLYCSSVSGCGKGIVFQFSKKFYFATPSMSYQAYLDESGAVTFHYHEAFNQSDIGNGGGASTDCVNGSRTSWNSYFGPYIGLYRAGASDLSSATFPWSGIQRDTQITFNPVDGCPDCGGNGICNLTSRSCECSNNFAGDSCTECATGFFGPACSPCRTCQNGGTCNDGIEGSGYCTCPPPYSGKNCSDTCTNPANDQSCNDGCGQGYCLCGKCICDSDYGWTGDTCSEWKDPCNQYSLDGCTACVSQSTVTCNFCKDDRICFAGSDQTVKIGEVTTTCKGQYLTPATVSTCVTNIQSPPPDSTFAIITVIVVFACLGICACLTLITVCACRKRPPNPHSISAVPGVPDFAFPHREREIMGVSRLPIQGRNGRPVQGIPLKQIQLAQLVQIQREARGRNSNASNNRKTNFPEKSDVELNAIKKGIPVYVD